MKKSAYVTSAIFAGLLASQAQAQDLSYSFVDLSYTEVDLDIDGEDISGDGFTGAVSFELSDTFFIGGSVSQADYDFGVDQDQYEFGIGARAGINDTTDLYGTISYIDADFSLGQLGSIDDTGYGLAAGIRSMVARSIELNGQISYVDIFDDDSTGFSVGGRYYFNESFSLGLGYQTADDVDGYSISGRFNF